MSNKKIRYLIGSILLSLSFVLGACSQSAGSQQTEVNTELSGEKDTGSPEQSSFDLSQVPAYSGEPYVVVNNNNPFFKDSDLTTEAFEKYSDLDSLGRCGAAYANVCQEIMPTEKRGAIGMVKPTGWQTVKYDWVDGKYLYNRCHLIGYQLSGENANEKNLITGTRYLNVDGMLPFENLVADYVHETDHHVLYRVTPVFENSNLVASGVLMEAQSVEDDDVLFCVYCYNVQPKVTIDYATGESHASEDTNIQETSQSTGEQTYIVNENTKKFHLPSCSSVKDMNSGNKREFTGDRQEGVLSLRKRRVAAWLWFPYLYHNIALTNRQPD